MSASQLCVQIIAWRCQRQDENTELLDTVF